MVLLLIVGLPWVPAPDLETEVRVSHPSRQHEGMSDLLWTEAKSFFDPELMGGLPDVHVPATSIADWQALLDLIRSSRWSWEYREGDAVVDLPSAETVFARPADAELVSIRLWPASGMLAIFRPWASEGNSIDFDVDLTELQGQERLDAFCRFLAIIGRELGKPVLMSPESSWGYPVLGFDPTADRVVLLAEPWDAVTR